MTRKPKDAVPLGIEDFSNVDATVRAALGRDLHARYRASMQARIERALERKLRLARYAGREEVLHFAGEHATALVDPFHRAAWEHVHSVLWNAFPRPMLLAKQEEVRDGDG